MRTTKHDPTVSVPLTEFNSNQRPPGNGMWNHPQNHISSLLQYAMVCPDNPQLLDCTLTKSKGQRRVLVCYGCFNNIISQTGWFNKRDLLSHGSQGWGPRSKCWFVFLEASLLGLQLAIFCVLTWPPKIWSGTGGRGCGWHNTVTEKNKQKEETWSHWGKCGDLICGNCPNITGKWQWTSGQNCLWWLQLPTSWIFLVVRVKTIFIALSTWPYMICD